MMQDYTLKDIVDEIYLEKYIPFPKKIAIKIIKHILRAMVKILKNPKNSIALRDAGVARFYHRINFADLERSFMDVDEVRMPAKRRLRKELIPVKILKILDAKRSPRFRMRSKPDSTFVYHRGTYIN